MSTGDRGDWTVRDDWIAAALFASRLAGSRPALTFRWATPDEVWLTTLTGWFWPGGRAGDPTTRSRKRRRGFLTDEETAALVKHVAQWERTRITWARTVARWYSFALGALSHPSPLGYVLGKSLVSEILVPEGTSADPDLREADLREAKILAHAVEDFLDSHTGLGRSAARCRKIARFVALLAFCSDLAPEGLEGALARSLEHRERIPGTPEVATPSASVSSIEIECLLPDGSTVRVPAERVERRGCEIVAVSERGVLTLARAHTPADAEVARYVIFGMQAISGVLRDPQP